MFKSLFKPKPPTPEQIQALEDANKALRGRVFQIMGSDTDSRPGLASLGDHNRYTWCEVNAA
jgi:hypothetical protein